MEQAWRFLGSSDKNLNVVTTRANQWVGLLSDSGETQVVMVVEGCGWAQGDTVSSGGAGSQWGPWQSGRGGRWSEGFWSLWGACFLPFHLSHRYRCTISQFISSLERLWSTTGTQQSTRPQPCSLGTPAHALRWRWSGCQAVLALSHPRGAAAQGEPHFFPDTWFPPHELRHCTARRGQLGHYRHRSQQLPASLPACWDTGRSTLPCAPAWARTLTLKSTF